jgi:hypothetical protein
MTDEYFLNQWFSRSLKRSLKPCSSSWMGYMADWQMPPILDIHKSLFPINLQSSQCYFLPVSDSRSSLHEFFEHCYSSSLFESSHSFSVWLFLPDQFQLNIQIGSVKVKSLLILLNSDEKYDFDNEKCVSISNRWIHMVLTKIDFRSNYQIWIDGQRLSKVSQYPKTFEYMDKTDSWINFVIFHKSDNNSLEPPIHPRLADLNAFNQYLTFVAIRVIHKQQMLIKQINSR